MQSEMQSDIEISQYISTKLCHDLAGTLGAINSGVDFLESDNRDMRIKALELVKTSSANTVHKLVFYRHAYGIAKHQGEANLDEIKKAASEYLVGSKVTLNFHEKYFHLQNVFVSANVGKLLLCIIQHAYLNLIHGGEIKVTIETSKDINKISISAAGKSPKLNEEKIDILNGKTKEHELTVHNCISFFAYKFAKKIEVELEIDTSKQDHIDYFISF